MEWLREENRRLTRMTFLSGVAFLLNVGAVIATRFLTDGHLADLLLATSILLAFIAGSAIATERAVVAQSVRIKRLEDRLAVREKEADA